MALSRFFRSLLKVRLIGTLIFGGSGGVYRLTRPTRSGGKIVLNDAAAAALARIVPVMLKDAIEPEPAPVARTSGRLIDVMACLPLATQIKVQNLFGVLPFGASRRVLNGLPDQSQDAKTDDMNTFLQSWKVHRIDLLQSAYDALHDLIVGPWYSNEATWAGIDYPGPINAFC